MYGMELVVDSLARYKNWLFVCVGGITQVQLVQVPRSLEAVPRWLLFHWTNWLPLIYCQVLFLIVYFWFFWAAVNTRKTSGWLWSTPAITWAVQPEICLRVLLSAFKAATMEMLCLDLSVCTCRHRRRRARGALRTYLSSSVSAP